MDLWNRNGLLIAGVLLAAVLSGARGQSPADSLPPGVTPAMIATGKKVFKGEGLCLACHGEDGKGIVGPNLSDKEWLHGNGSFSEIVDRVLKGVGASESKTGQIMPPKGGSGISDSQVRAVAAYVWSLSRPARG